MVSCLCEILHPFPAYPWISKAVMLGCFMTFKMFVSMVTGDPDSIPQ